MAEDGAVTDQTTTTIVFRYSKKGKNVLRVLKSGLNATEFYFSSEFICDKNKLFNRVNMRATLLVEDTAVATKMSRKAMAQCVVKLE